MLGRLQNQEVILAKLNLQLTTKKLRIAELEASPPDAMVSLPIEWGTLRDKFFDECVDELPFSTPANPLKKANLTPHNLFEWFKNQITKAT